MDLFPGIEHKIKQGGRVDESEAAWLFENASDEELKGLASIVKHRYHEGGIATYLKMAIVNFTNICVARCDYCAFYKLPHEQGTYTLDEAGLLAKVRYWVEMGCTMIGFNAGFNPKLSLEDYGRLFAKVKEEFPAIQLYEMTVAEFMFYCKKDKLSYLEGAQMMQSFGSKWIPGGGAEVLDENFRDRHSPGKYKVKDYFTAQGDILSTGLRSTATMCIGFDETLTERLNHLRTLRLAQDQWQGAIPSFLCWTYKPYNTRFGGQEISTKEYLRWLAVCRIYLDNIKNIRTSVLTKNEDALIGLDYGANDFDLPTEDEVTVKAGAEISQDFEGVLNAGRKLGYTLIHRLPLV